MSTQQPCPSIDEIVDLVFARCMARYGQAYFLARWEGTKLSVVKADWHRVLEGLERNQRAVHYALDRLPEKPPMAHEFRAIAANCPAPRHECLTWEPKPDPKRLAQVRAQLATLKAPKPPEDPLEVAKGLRERELAGEKLSLGQRDFMRRVLHPEKALPAASGNERTPA